MKTKNVITGIIGIRYHNPNNIKINDICILDSGLPTSVAVRVTYISQPLQMYGMIEHLDNSDDCKYGVLMSRLKPI